MFYNFTTEKKESSSINRFIGLSSIHIFQIIQIYFPRKRKIYFIWFNSFSFKRAFISVKKITRNNDRCEFAQKNAVGYIFCKAITQISFRTFYNPKTISKWKFSECTMILYLQCFASDQSCVADSFRCWDVKRISVDINLTV